MAIPSGSGTEVLKHLHYAGVDNATWRDIIGTQGSGTQANHIYRIILEKYRFSEFCNFLAFGGLFANIFHRKIYFRMFRGSILPWA